MTNQELFDRLQRGLNNIKTDNELDCIHDAFIVWYAQYGLGLDPDECIEGIITDHRAEGVDALLFDHKNLILYLIQACTVEKYENTENNYGESDIKNTLAGIKFLLMGKYRGQITPELENLVDEYHDLAKTGDYKTKIVFLTMKKDPIDQKFIESFKVENKGIDIDFITFGKIIDLYQNNYLVLRLPAPEKITFELLSSPMEKDEPFRSVVFSIKAKELAKTYSEHREKLFQQNVRNPMGLGKRINDLIFNTATNEQESSSFWYFNNGIHIICKSANVPPSKKVIILTLPQIINGAQTTHAIYEAYKNGQLKDDVEILVKAIEADDKKFIDHVTLYSNSQNAIRLRDLNSNDEIQERIQKVLRDSYKYFYQRKRGEFETLYPTEEHKTESYGERYKDKIIDNEKAALSYLAFYLEKPVAAKTDKWKIFLKDGGYYENIFDTNVTNLAERILLSWKAIRFVEYKKKQYRESYNKEKKKENAENTVVEKYFITQADYYVLRLMNYFFTKDSIGYIETKEIIKLIEMFDERDDLLHNIYDRCIDEITSQIKREKHKPNYYMNKFFKEEKNIVLILEKLESGNIEEIYSKSNPVQLMLGDL